MGCGGGWVATGEVGAVRSVGRWRMVRCTSGVGRRTDDLSKVVRGRVDRHDRRSRAVAWFNRHMGT